MILAALASGGALYSIIGKIYELIRWAEVNLRYKTGSERRAAVIKMACELISIPFIPDWIQNLFKASLFGAIVDMIVSLLNKVTGGSILELGNTKENEDALADIAQRAIAAQVGGKAIVIPSIESKSDTAPSTPQEREIYTQARFDELVAKMREKYPEDWVGVPEAQNSEAKEPE